ncbi:MAG: extracellular solute-binding protein, partial [Actinomycetota bacterium]|nr:extracellular solute-binding protein [Actinomycetota bacterium]
MTEGTFTRRDFLRAAAGAAAAAATGAACGSGADKPSGGAANGRAGKGGGALRIAQSAHFVPAYDQWFDSEYTKRWGEQHDVDVVVDHIQTEQLTARAAAEVAAQQGHDLFWFPTQSAAFEDEVIDHRELVEEVESKVGKMVPLVERSIFNPKTKKWFGFSDTWWPGPVHYRSDVWDAVGIKPETWDAILAGAPKVKAAGHPIGLGLSSSDLDGSVTLQSLLHAYGSSLQDEGGNVALNRPEAVEAVKIMTAIYRAGMTDDVFTWDSSSNNRYLAEGRGSLIVNAVSALRAIEAQDPGLAAKVELLRTPQGPAGRHGVYGTGTYVIWKFARNQETAKRFVVDLVLNYQEAIERSGFYNLPSFPGAVVGLPGLLAREPKYSFLTEATAWSTNLGHPGYLNGAVDEVFAQFIIPEMFAAAAKGEATPEEAV